jgi:ABC-2 type transport system permease protein
MNQWISFYTLLRRECYRFLKIPNQTIIGPLLETYLYISVFGAALGSRINEIHGVQYAVFIIPGLLLMSMITGSYANNSASLMQQKMMHSIDDQLTSPVSHFSLLAAYTLGGLIRSCIVVFLAFVTASLLLGFHVYSWPLFILGLGLSGLFFASLGVLVGLVAESNEQATSYQTFIMQPLIFLGGTFYSALLLPEPFRTLTHFNPIFYMINTVRHGMLGVSDINPYWALLAIAVAVAGIVSLNMYLFQKGYRLRS